MALDSSVDIVQSAKIAEPMPTGAARLPAVDIVRGLAIVFMALDHVRDFTYNATFEPEDLAHTFPALFLTRWVTHFCAPVFFFLAGSAAYLLFVRTGSIRQMQRFLVTRGAWLVFVELTLVWFAWTFLFPGHLAGVLWALGWSMVLLALILRLPTPWVAAVALLVIAFHDLSDAVTVGAFGQFGWLWAFLHVRTFMVIPALNWPTFVLFPIIPLAAVMAAGYAFGCILIMERKRRITTTAVIGILATALFILLRGLNFYGNPSAAIAATSPGPWHAQSTFAMTIVSFLDVEKYPSSLQFLLMTMGPALLVLATFDHMTSRAQVPLYLQPLQVFGRVPFFFYVVHIFAIHLVAISVYATLHEPTGWLLHGGFFWSQRPTGTGISLPEVWILWLLVVVALYFPCAAFAGLKARRNDWWLAYL